jgi:TonB family protein
MGKPIAGKGLEIKTVRPRFTQYTRIMTAPQSPVFRIHFRKDGTVERVETLRSSGVADVDRPVIDAIYKWRAVGEELGRLPDPPNAAQGGVGGSVSPGVKVPTISIEMRILL